MPSKNWSKTVVLNPEQPNVRTVVESLSQTWQHSPRVGGRLKLVANPLSRTHRSNTGISLLGQKPPSSVDGIGSNWLPATSSSAVSNARNRATNEALAKLRGKLYKGGASWGVTLASYKQSRDLIVGIATNAVKQISALEHRARAIGYDSVGSGLSARKRRKLMRSKRRVKRVKASLANMYLATIFGLVPLLADIHAAMNTVVQQAIPPQGVTSRATADFKYGHAVWNPNGTPANVVNATGSVRVAISSLVYISNPNLWLANRMGLINPATVAWDLVPWSFVINMFANVNQLLNQFTDYAGLTFGNLSTTTTTKMSGSQVGYNTYPVSHPFFGGAEVSAQVTWKSRGVGAMPTPVLQFKIPDLDVSLAATAVSLLVQRSRKLASFLSL